MSKVTKKPWEMTKAEFLVGFPLERKDMDFVEHGGIIERLDDRAFVVHLGYIKNALSEGKSVPTGVLNDYPDLSP